MILKKKNPYSDFIKEFNEQFIFMAAFRYFLGRESISAASFADLLIKYWDKFDKSLQDKLFYEIKNEIELYSSEVLNYRKKIWNNILVNARKK